jgi:hypothetical protein
MPPAGVDESSHLATNKTAVRGTRAAMERPTTFEEKVASIVSNTRSIYLTQASSSVPLGKDWEGVLKHINDVDRARCAYIKKECGASTFAENRIVHSQVTGSIKDFVTEATATCEHKWKQGRVTLSPSADAREILESVTSR